MRIHSNDTLEAQAEPIKITRDRYQPIRAAVQIDHVHWELFHTPLPWGAGPVAERSLCFVQC